MPIKRIPLCPFCGSEMVGGYEYFHSPEFETVDISTMKQSPSEEPRTLFLKVWVCKDCGCVALWSGAVR